MNDSASRRTLQKQWMSNLARCRKENYVEIQLTGLTLDEECVEYLIHQMRQEEFPAAAAAARSTDKAVPRLDSLVLSGCRFPREKDLQRFSECVVASAARLTIARGHPSAGPGRLNSGKSLSEVFKFGCMTTTSFVKSILLVDLDLEWKTNQMISRGDNNSDNNLAVLALRDLLEFSDNCQQLCDLGFVRCSLNKAAVGYWVPGLENRPMRTLVVDQCNIIDNNSRDETMACLVQALNNYCYKKKSTSYDDGSNNNSNNNNNSRRMATEPSCLEALTLTCQFFSDKTLDLLSSVLEIHCTSLKSLRLTQGGGFNVVTPPAVQQQQRFHQAMKSHVHLQLFDCHPNFRPHFTWTLKEEYNLLQRNYFVWRLEYICSALTPTLNPSMWPTLLKRVGTTGGPTPVFYFLRCHRIDEEAQHQPKQQQQQQQQQEKEQQQQQQQHQQPQQQEL